MKRELGSQTEHSIMTNGGWDPAVHRDIIPYELKCLNLMGEPNETSSENTWAY